MPKRDEYYQDEELSPPDDRFAGPAGRRSAGGGPGAGRGGRGRAGPRRAERRPCPLAERAAPAGSGGPADTHPADDLPGLFARGKQQGFVTADEILQIQPEPEMHLEEVDEIYAELLDLNIEVLDEQEWPDPELVHPRRSAASRPPLI